jgi:hypothetical protein
MAKWKSKKKNQYKSFQLSKSSIEELNNLFESASPTELRENIIEVYHHYIINCHDALPDDFQKMASNVYLLIRALDEVRAN